MCVDPHAPTEPAGPPPPPPRPRRVAAAAGSESAAAGLIARASENPLLALLLVSQLGVGGVSVASLVGGGPDEAELRAQWEAERADQVAEADARDKAAACAKSAATAAESAAELAKDVSDLSHRVDDVFALQGEHWDLALAIAALSARAAAAEVPAHSPVAAELRGKALLRYQAARAGQD